MLYDQVVLRYGDLMVKGRNRNKFEKRMLEQVKQALLAYENVTYYKSFGRLFVLLNGHSHEPIVDRLKDLFGIVSLSPVVSTENDLEKIRAAALGLMQALPEKPKTFKVSAKRAWKTFPHTSQEMNHLVGGHVLHAIPDLKVNVSKPEVELRVDIQSEATYVFYEVIPGAGGFPFASNGKAMLLLSGGIDSPVAGWLALRKGLELEAVHFHSYPFTSEQAKDKVIELAKRLSYFSGEPIKLHLVPFTEIQTTLVQAKSDNLIITLMRRAMMRITEQLAERNGASGIVTGESLGQVASQTLPSMNVIGRATQLPQLKPLIMMDKHEIIRMAERIGTFETSILPFEDCCTLFLPKSPSTNPNLRIAEKIESLIPNYKQLLLDAVEGTEELLLTPMQQTTVQTAGEDSWF
ncbi:tRNA 4-thiouridine(8) synthase ThiI [Paenibacillus sp. FSL H8-0548]|uniref:tRNA uracil 4-sulfurtransferase ThiI n=1 Tax=Paenibacillus sp. FSL H8-0548 TaxID=1920422 RepID=UPI00096DCAC4|nr:tRNA uracil 4-sulfurtransferase ThiI [Paenibacillus sp. FSL H8-0548]OMF36988.1 tRNA 4-thiouridine(8) synthase ThiI [Paenibacillus sp. FSL H8-0548]